MDLEKRIRKDIEILGLPLDFSLDLRGYSKSYEGRYDPNNKKVILYTKNKVGDMLPYRRILKVCVHEVVHHYQWTCDPFFRRVKGVMHNQLFERMEEKYLKKINEEERIWLH